MSISEHLRAQAQRSRARIINTPATLTLEQWEQTLVDFDGMCAYCLARPFDVLEHFQPIAIAGTTIKNCIPACYKCNHKKRDYMGDKLIAIFGMEVISRIQTYLDAREAATPDYPVRFKVQRPTLQIKEVYALNELIDSLPCKIVALCEKASIDPSVLLHARVGGRIQQGNRAKLLEALSQVFERSLNEQNVTGINIVSLPQPETMQDKPSYSLRELFDNLPIPIKQLGERAHVNEVTVARIRDGKPARRSTVNRLLREMGKPDIYDRSLSLANVTGVNIQGEKQDSPNGDEPSADAA